MTYELLQRSGNRPRVSVNSVTGLRYGIRGHASDNLFRLRRTVFPRSVSSPPIQARLKVGESNDKFEQEADRMADEVMRMPDSLPLYSAVGAFPAARPSPSIQAPGVESARGQGPCSQCAEGKEMLNKAPQENSEAVIQAKSGEAGKPSGKAISKGRDKPELEFRSPLDFSGSLSGFTPTSEPKAGDYPVIWYRVWNTGWATAPEHYNRLTIYKADVCSGCRDEKDMILRLEVPAPSIVSITQEGQAEYEGTFLISMPLPAGHYDAYVELDVQNQVHEINEDNNTAFMVFTVRPDDEGTEQRAFPKRKEANPVLEIGSDAASVTDRLKGGGEPLSKSVRAFFEPRFGYDFSRVRVHTDERAETSARALNSHAFTVGNDIVFDRGRFDPTAREGRGLLAHELAHVVQQSSAEMPRLHQPNVGDDLPAMSQFHTGGAGAVGEAGDRQDMKRPAMHGLGCVSLSRPAVEPDVIQRAPGDRPGRPGDDAKVVSIVWEVEGRSIVVVESGGERKAFYKRSTSELKGRIEGHAGPQKDDWAPFAGFQETEGGRGRFVKEIYYRGKMPNNPLYGYGSVENLRISEWLARQDLPNPVETDWRNVQQRLQKLNVTEVFHPLKLPEPKGAPYLSGSKEPLRVDEIAGEIHIKKPPTPPPGGKPPGEPPVVVDRDLIREANEMEATNRNMESAARLARWGLEAYQFLGVLEQIAGSLNMAAATAAEGSPYRKLTRKAQETAAQAKEIADYYESLDLRRNIPPGGWVSFDEGWYKLQQIQFTYYETEQHLHDTLESVIAAQKDLASQISDLGDALAEKASALVFAPVSTPYADVYLFADAAGQVRRNLIEASKSYERAQRAVYFSQRMTLAAIKLMEIRLRQLGASGLVTIDIPDSDLPKASLDEFTMRR